MRRLFGFLRPHRRFFIALTLVNVLLSAMLTIGPLVTKAIVDDVIGARQLDLLLPYVGAFLLVTAVRTTMTYFYSFGQNKLGQLIMTDVRAALYRKMLALPFLENRNLPWFECSGNGQQRSVGIPFRHEYPALLLEK